MRPYDVRDTDKAGLDYNTYYIVRIIIIIIITIWSHVGLSVVPMHTRQLTDMVIRLPTAKRDDRRPTQYLPKRILKTFQYDVILCYSSRRRVFKFSRNYRFISYWPASRVITSWLLSFYYSRVRTGRVISTRDSGGRRRAKRYRGVFWKLLDAFRSIRMKLCTITTIICHATRNIVVDSCDSRHWFSRSLRTTLAIRPTTFQRKRDESLL